MLISNESLKSPYYAVIDLGSNSFHMLITRQLANSVQVVDKVKRKVRLASGLTQDNTLSEAAIARGLECLSFFAERLQDIPNGNVRIVATATVRLAKNKADFLARANKVLGRKITLLSGEQEAELIYLGVAHTNCCADQRLVIDIGGASTELIVGTEQQAIKIVSLNLGCVTFNQQFFKGGTINKNNFQRATQTATNMLQPLIDSYLNIGWQTVLGGSGTMQALAEILIFSKQPTIISREFLAQIEEKLLSFSNIAQINLPGLRHERIPVFISGVAILNAIFDCFKIDKLQLSSGALREGLLYQMLPNVEKLTIRQQTINSLTQRYHVDKQHAENVKKQASYLFDSFSSTWALNKDNSYQLLLASCDLHEIGLLLEFKHHQKHSAYIIQHADLVGFDQADKQLLSALVLLYKGEFSPNELTQSVTTNKVASYLLAILRLAVILCQRRKDDVLPQYQAHIDKLIHLNISTEWLNCHPLIHDELMQENQYLASIGLQIKIN